MKRKPWKYLKTKTGGKVKVDAEDFEDVSSRSWRVLFSTKTNKPSVITSIRTGSYVRTMTLGQYLMKPKKGLLVYPRRWQEGLDYRKQNLIICTMKERQRMLPKRGEKSTSQFKGVTYIKSKRVWRARIEKDGSPYFIGDFEKEEAAALAYNKVARELFGEFSYQNQVYRNSNRRFKKKKKSS